VQCACNAGYQRLCPNGWTQLDSTCVRFYPTFLDWASARQRCVDLGGNLAYPANQTQQDLLWSMAGVQTWIGVDRSQGSWRTPEGQAISYSKWCPGQPDSSSSGYCGLIGWESSGCWDDYACGQSRPYLCQMDPFGPCTPCPAGKFAAAGAAKCTNCAPGKFSADVGASTCADCEAGKYSTSPTNTIVCTSCPANKYSAAVGASFCAECEAGKYSAAGSTNASNCRVELRQWSKMDAAAGVTGTGPGAYQSYRMSQVGADLLHFGGRHISGQLSADLFNYSTSSKAWTKLAGRGGRRHRYGTEWKMVSHNDNGGPRHLRLRRSH
jgi:hypothetical protein